MQLVSDTFALGGLIKRNIKLFLKDKATVFFSLLAPLIVLILYILFLGNIQVNSVKAAMPQGVILDDKLIRGFVDSWLISGVIGVSVITVALNSMLVMVDDRQHQIYHDALASPLKSSIFTLGYFIASYIITIVICIGIFMIGIIYLAIKGSLYMSVGHAFETLANILLSCFSSTLLMMFIVSFFKSSNAVGAFSGIISAVSGFIIGAYMPMSTFPKAVQYIANVLPATHSTGIFRNTLMIDALDKLAHRMPEIFKAQLADSYSFSLNFFGHNVGKTTMYIVVAVSIPILLAILLLRFKLQRKDK